MNSCLPSSEVLIWASNWSPVFATPLSVKQRLLRSSIWTLLHRIFYEICLPVHKTYDLEEMLLENISSHRRFRFVWHIDVQEWGAYRKCLKYSAHNNGVPHRKQEKSLVGRCDWMLRYWQAQCNDPHNVESQRKSDRNLTALMCAGSLLIACRARGLGIIKLSDEMNSCACSFVVAL